MFKKKTWKRGDKLNAKELNRIEEGIADNGEFIISVDEDATNMDSTGPVFSNWSITIDEFKALLAEKKRIGLECKVFVTHDNNSYHVSTLWFHAGECEVDKYYLTGYTSGMGFLKIILSCDGN